MIRRASFEQRYLEKLISRLQSLQHFFRNQELPTHETTPTEWHEFLAALKNIVGNASNDMSFIAALMAKDYLCSILPMREFDVGLKPQGAPGLDIDERTADGRRVIAEIKTTTPYNGPDLGAQQKATFAKDFGKLNAATADMKFFFVTDRATFDIMKRKYHNKIPEVTVVLLPQGEVYPHAV